MKTPVPRFVLVSDLDHTMVDHNDASHSSLLAFDRLWVSAFSHDSLLVFSTGRSPEKYWELQKEAPMLTPDILVCSVGTEIMRRTKNGYEPDEEWSRKLDEGWDRKVAEETSQELGDVLKLQESSEQRPHKISFHMSVRGEEAEKAIEKLRALLAERGVVAKVIYSGGIDVDILAKGAGKGKALEFLLEKFKASGLYPTDGVQVNGDSGNDVELFEVPGVRGCMVANAHPELRTWVDNNLTENICKATKNCAGGIVEALTHFQTVPESSPYVEYKIAKSFVDLDVSSVTLAKDFYAIASNGKKVYGEEAARLLEPKSDGLNWIDLFDASSLGEGVWHVTFQQWHQAGPTRTGEWVSVIVGKEDDNGSDRFVWNFMQMTTV